MIDNGMPKAGDIVYCIKATDRLKYHELYKVRGAEYIDGDLIVAVEDKNGWIEHASLTYFQGFCRAENWDDEDTLESVMSAEGYTDAMDMLQKMADAVEAISINDTDGLLDIIEEMNCDDSDDDEDEYEDDFDDESCEAMSEEAGCVCKGDCETCTDKNNFAIPKKPIGEPKATRKSILETALKCVNGDREQDYGTPENNFKVIADMWSAYKHTDISAVDVAAMLALLKIARIASGNAKDDNWIDLAGYAACGGEIQANQ